MCFAGAAFTFAQGVSPGDEPSAQVSAPAVTIGPLAPVPDAVPAAAKSEAPAKSAGPSAEVTTDLAAAGVPQRVYIEALSIDAPVLPISVEGSTLTPPPDPQDLGWWSGGAQPGAVRGSALITGHTVNAGGGALDDLETLQVGAEIRVRTARGVIRYVAESVDVLDKDTIARRAPQLFDQGVAGRLVLVTCEDWDGSGYLSNVVVTAVPLT
ncbi:class F sortase [Nocardioides sp.]|uniref:class F sortase n=1 Tax=Nocardioides sp. TaxID=35761 RepID=UPI002C79D9B1|nr:sortase [Nocardioides sp.]HXH78639.1 sortase [Nocardioides sp.]